MQSTLTLPTAHAQRSTHSCQLPAATEGQQPLPAPQLTAKRAHKQVPLCHHQYRTQQHVRKSHFSTPNLSNPQFYPCPKYPDQFTAM